MYTEARQSPTRHARGSPVAIPGTPSEALRPETPTTSDQARLDAGTTLPALATQSDSAAVIYSPLRTSFLVPSPILTLHRPASRSSFLTFSGLNGTYFTVTLKGASASSTAPANAAADGIVPPSPTPFTPSGLSGQTTSIWAIFAVGTSFAVGRR